MARKVFVAFGIVLVCCSLLGCLRRVVGYRLPGVRVGWCKAANRLVLDSQDLAGVLVQRCVSAPLVPLPIYCEPWCSMASSVGMGNVGSEQLLVRIERFDLVRGNTSLSAKFQDIEWLNRYASVTKPAESFSGMEIELGPGGAMLINVTFDTDHVTSGAQLVVVGTIHGGSGLQERFECEANLVPRSGKWEWLNPLVTVD